MLRKSVATGIPLGLYGDAAVLWTRYKKENWIGFVKTH